MTTDRTRRYSEGATMTPKTVIESGMFGPVSAKNATIVRMPGSDWMTSETKFATASSRPR